MSSYIFSYQIKSTCSFPITKISSNISFFTCSYVCAIKIFAKFPEKRLQKFVLQVLCEIFYIKLTLAGITPSLGDFSTFDRFWFDDTILSVNAKEVKKKQNFLFSLYGTWFAFPYPFLQQYLFYECREPFSSFAVIIKIITWRLTGLNSASTSWCERLNQIIKTSQEILISFCGTRVCSAYVRRYSPSWAACSPASRSCWPGTSTGTALRSGQRDR